MDSCMRKRSSSLLQNLILPENDTARFMCGAIFEFRCACLIAHRVMHIGVFECRCVSKTHSLLLHQYEDCEVDNKLILSMMWVASLRCCHALLVVVCDAQAMVGAQWHESSAVALRGQRSSENCMGRWVVLD
jgi:hypothetical protein